MDRELLKSVLQLRFFENLKYSQSMFLTEPAIDRLEVQKSWFSNSYCLQHRKLLFPRLPSVFPSSVAFLSSKAYIIGNRSFTNLESSFLSHFHSWCIFNLSSDVKHRKYLSQSVTSAKFPGNCSTVFRNLSNIYYGASLQK